MTDPTATVPVFEQSDKPVRLGSEVLLVYPAGDCDVAMVTGIERGGENPRGVWVQVPGQVAQLVDVGALAPYEDEDFEDEDGETPLQRMQREERSGLAGYHVTSTGGRND